MTPPLSADEQAILDLVDEAELVDLTSKLIAADSENPGGTEAAAVEVLRRACEEYGLQTEVTEAAPGRPNLVATLPAGARAGAGSGAGAAAGAGAAGGAAPVMFLGHSDVVPAGEGWTHDPYTPVVEGDRLYGRGATDMKGGLAAVVVAMGALARSNVVLPAAVQLVCAVDEEEHGLGIRAFTRQAAAVQTEVPGTTGGPAQPPGSPAYSACIVAEPTDLETVIGCRGDSYLELTVTGIAAHSGNPSDGRNAIDAASRILELIRQDGERLAANPDPLLGHGTWNVGRIEGGHGTSIVAAGCTVSIDRRLMPDEDPEQLAAALRKQISEAGIDIDGITVQLEVTMEMPGFRTSADSQVVAAAVESIADAGGGQSPVGGWTAACDGGFIARDFGVDTIVLGPGGLNDQAHQPDESVSIAEMTTAARSYALMCLRIPSGQLDHTSRIPNQHTLISSTSHADPQTKSR